MSDRQFFGITILLALLVSPYIAFVTFLVSPLSW
jgi:hypothetical protein